MIYLDNAATTMRKPPQVGEAVLQAMNTMGNASRGAHREALTASRIVYNTRLKLAELFHCARADHVAFTCNSTEALNIAISGTLEPGDHVITTMMEHNSVLRPLYRHMDEHGGELSFVQCDDLGRPKYEEFEALITPKTRAIVCTHASNLTGNVVDLRCVGSSAPTPPTSPETSWICAVSARSRRNTACFSLSMPPRRRGSSPLTWKR